MKYAIIIAIILAALPIAIFGNLSVSGKSLTYNGQQVFLSGVNLEWDKQPKSKIYKYFGDGAYAHFRTEMEGWLEYIAKAGGNAVRVWLHIDGRYSPAFDSNGHAIGNDTDSIIAELDQFLDAAQKSGIFVIITLWEDWKRTDNLINMFKDDASLRAYIDKVLTPMAKALAGKKALASWEIINDASDSVKPGVSDANPCFDTKKLTNSDPNANLSMKEVLNFINRQAAAIKTASPGVLVTAGAISETLNTDVCNNCFNYYKDECLKAGGGVSNGVLDYYTIETYSEMTGNYSDYSVMNKNAADLALDKPILIGDFDDGCSKGKNASEYFKHAYNGGYVGILWWQYDEGLDCVSKKTSQDQGMAAITGLTTNGKISVNIFDI